MHALARRLGDEEVPDRCAHDRLALTQRPGGPRHPDGVGERREAGPADRLRAAGAARPGRDHPRARRPRRPRSRPIRAGHEDLARARQLGLARYVTAPIAGNLAESLTSAGRWDEALEVIREALGLDPAPFGRGLLLVLPGRIAVARGEQETAAQIVAAACARCPPRMQRPTARCRSPGWTIQTSCSRRATWPEPWPPRARSRGATHGRRPAVPVAAAGRPGCGPAPTRRSRPLPAEAGGLAELQDGAGAGGGGHRAAGPGGAGSRRGVRRRGLPRRRPARTGPPGMPPPRPGSRSGSPTRWPTRCCAPRPPPRPAETGTGPRPGCSRRRNWRPGWAPGRCWQQITQLARRARIDLAGTAADQAGPVTRSG